jgi:beta-glucanase (GH16 family)
VWTNINIDENGDSITGVSDVRQNWHTYEIDWQPDYINWSIDDKVVRTLQRKSTYNDTTKQYNYPQTPSRVQLSLWPGGLPSNGEGTIEWAGGLVDWDSEYMTNGYYYAQVKDISVECYDPPSGDDSGSNKAYYYTSTVGTQDTVAIGTNNTIIGSLQATGNDPDKSVPGMSGGGNAGNSGGESSDSSSGGVATNNNGDTSGSAYDASTSNGGSTSFDQGMGGSSGSASGTSQASHVVAGSAVALLGFFIAALML